MTKFYILLFALCGLIGLSVGQIVQPGRCDIDIPVVTDLNLEEFAGTWYELQRSESPEQRTDCAQFDFTLTSGTFTVNHKGVNNNFLEDSWGTATTSSEAAKLKLDIPIFDEHQRASSNNGKLNIDGEAIDFWVLLTDNNVYAVTYSCKNISPTEKSIHLWILGRTRSYPTIMTIAFINTHLMQMFGFGVDKLRDVDQSDIACYVLPVIEPGKEVILDGQCNTSIPVQQRFDVAAFTGTWHQISSYYTESSAGSCVRAQYDLDGGIVQVINSQVIDQKLLTIEGTASISSTDGSAKLKVTLNISPTATVEQELWVLSTDYSTYAVSYSCEDLSENKKRIYSWILSRERVLSPEAETRVNKVVDSLIELNDIFYLPTDHSFAGCFFFPEPTDRAVVFRGQCNNIDVPVTQDFDAVGYMGLWHNIELYPAPFQDGNCSNAFYELKDGAVDVRNTQVRDRTLDTINGVAVVASDDGSAKLKVTFPIAGTNQTVTTDYWVLDTNYTSYALVYSCFNLDADNMQVGSWKLSRSKSLALGDIAAIDRIMNSTKVLNQDYFKPVDQSVEGCDFIPIPEEGVPVLFPGTCDPNIGMQDFSFTRFTGIWYEIQAYPKIEQTGQCIKHEFKFLSNSEFNLTSSSVDDQFLLETQGRVVSTDSSGRLTITINTESGDIRIPFWIIDTDYDNYALAYACVDREDGLKGVWSWKLSSSKELSNAAKLAIDEAIAKVDVLDNKYYWDVDQSDRACFTLPVLEPGEPIILDGQCDTSIQGIEAFDVTKFSGRWRLIESYPADLQTGTCNEVDFDQTNLRTYDVTHTQVVDRGLDSISGIATVNADGRGSLQISLSNSNNLKEYVILDTDYASYALVYSCENLVPSSTSQRRVWSWKLSRSQALSTNANTAINKIINEIEVLNKRYFYKVNRTQEGCFYLPEVNPKLPVRFRGRCDVNIPVVRDFKPTEYMGLWHDIQSYPEAFQDGTCNNAYYTLVDGEVDVFNTQVIDQHLDTITGRAVVASDDGSAKLNVTFNVGGINVTTNYWVLDVDYTSYSLVYSCRPLDDEYVQISTWKLSRTKSLTSSAIENINAVMKTIPVLEDRYYLTRNQTDSGCFYFPEPTENPVIIPGRCDESIETVQNFNFIDFQGTWYEIEAYPKDEQPGECVNHEYTYVGSQEFELVSSSVRDQVRNFTNSIVAGSGGKLTISIVSGGETIRIPFWIIDVDYNDYALAYSCVNRGDSSRAVYSWKLSRRKELSQSAVSAINNAMASIDVLQDKYYKPINQTDEECFYLPDVPPGEPALFPGKCDENIRGVQNFNIARLEGRWRVLESYPSEVGKTCNEAIYSFNDASTVNAVHEYVVDQTLISKSGILRVSSTDGRGTLEFLDPASGQTASYVVLAIDYDSYAFVYQCENVLKDQKQYRKVTSWKLSRSNTLDQDAINSINNIIDITDVLDDSYFNKVNRTEAGCFYFPEVNRNTPVRFRGRCNEDIPVVKNFNPVTYMGLWHDIQSYPEDFQNGTCNNANYTLVDGVVDVYNTQVINQQLDTITGRAVLDSDDGSAKLKVTFNVGGIDVTTDYWVLAVDYTSYSLVYSCRPVDDEYVQVSTWKLSRTKSLTSSAIAEINDVMKNIPVLDDKYYIERDQTEPGCFYFPEPAENKPVVFPGRCDETISTQEGFDISQFLGVWHETAKYPYAVNNQCIDHRFESESSTSILHKSYHVVDQTLYQVNNSTVNLPSDSNTGKLNINIVVNGEVQTVPFWILATDYKDYALAYGCRNIDDNQRQIYSWKLSRTRRPTVEGSAAMDRAMENINVLENKYFNTIQQTDEACFYLPDLGSDDPVTFIGQCDPNIEVIKDFDVSKYLGRWRLIQTYNTDFQFGTCSQADYSLGTDAVLVVNTEVINQTLSTMIGTATVASTDGSGKLLVKFPTSDTDSDYWILGTDYDSYALVYSCRNIGNDRRRVWSWKMSRTNSLTDKATIAINDIMDKVNVLSDQYYQIINRSDEGCFYYPVADDKTPVVFPGQCDMSIPAVPRFDAEKYMGAWYDIASYPAPFQTGTCSKANYALVDGSVLVENTQVVNRLLETWIGSAVITSTDGTAKLNVTFNVEGQNVTTSYWVLDTDYSSYALVYSCENIDPYYRAVFSWKLSRTRELPEKAIEAVNKVIDSVQVLEQNYYYENGHTDDDCFYYPDNEGGNVILPGTCLEDSAVPAVKEFRPNLFAGTWYEISRFPSDVQMGACAFSEYSFTGATFGVTRSFVNNERQTNSTFQATVSDDGRGVISANINGVPFSSVYILGIDYNDYALGYSCRDLGDNTKQIFSWKLSRSRSGLSEAAQRNIDELVSSNRDLWEGYYETTRQDYDACFYYPEFDELPDTIELPGPCPNNIRGLPNFNPTDYLGTWYETARYPVSNQPGQCNRAKYDWDDSVQRVRVDNTEVSDRTLFTQLGFADVASTDGSGQLSVQFIVNGELRTANYYILATDYRSYSLVYSCRNLTNGWRQVSSWKLSRTKTLTTDAIDPVIAATQGLTPEYYQSTSQSDEDCFYIPDNEIDRAPRFRGQCAEITGMEGFDVGKFSGRWHEIKSYARDGGHPGECRSSNYEQDSSNTYEVTDKWVKDNEGSLLEGKVTVTTDGRLLRTMSDNRVEEIWVLDTDYISYALLYSCENIDDEYTRVWSAKYSRTRTLTQEAEDLMGPIIEDNLLLYEKFYLNVDQSDRTCFYYPNVTPGEVIIPGQCDSSAPVAQNFNISQFSGIWYNTERYDLVNGSCVGINYVVDDDGRIRVFTVEVRNAEDIHTEGTATVSDGAVIRHTRPSSDGNVTETIVVMETDYTGYAVVYNCTNVSPLERKVRAWKLSRTRRLSVGSNSAIDALIVRRQELHQPYFIEIEQPDNCPNPNSALLIKSSIILLAIGAILQRLL